MIPTSPRISPRKHSSGLSDGSRTFGVRREIEDSYLVAVDVTGDDKADASWEALRYCVACEPYAATDLDGDGSDELLVTIQGGSVTQYGVFQATESGGSVEFGPVRVGEPGDRKGGFPAGDIASIWVGGDEGFPTDTQGAVLT